MLAIVIPYFKRAFFDETLNSLANQTNNDFKVYIGNDASPDDPTDIIAKYVDDINIEYRHFEENLGNVSLTKHWDRCMSMTASEDWIMILADDDTLSVEVVEYFYGNLERINDLDCKVVRFSTQIIDEHGTAKSKIFNHPTIQDYSDSFSNRFFNGSRSSMSEYVFSKERYNKYGFREFPLAWHADDLAWLEFSEFGKIYTINSATIYFRLSDFNISRSSYLIEEKKELHYNFFTIIVREYFSDFNVKEKKQILRYYESITYNIGKGGFKFWIKFWPKFLQYFGLVEMLKFSRRVILNYAK